MKRKSILITTISIIVVIAIIATVLFVIGNRTKSAGTEEGVGADSETKPAFEIEFSYSEDYWKIYDLTNAVYKTQTEFENAVLSYIDQIATLLNKPDWYKNYKGMDKLYIALDINDADDGISQGNIEFSQNYLKTSYTCDLHLSNTMFKHNRSQLVHVLTKLIITKREGYPTSLEEGFCEYIQNELGMGIGSSNYGLDIHNYLREFTKQHKENPESDNMNIIRDEVGNPSGYMIVYDYKFAKSKNVSYYNYWVSSIYSFVDYLVDTYGIESVMKLIDGYDDSIYYLLNQNGLSGLVSDWKQFLENYPCKMTGDEIDAQIAQIKSTHGY